MKTSVIKMMVAAFLAGSMLAPTAMADTPYNHPMKKVLRAATSGPETLNQLLGSGISVDARDNDGETALMKASEKGRIGAVKALIAAGANVNARDEDGETALMMAADEGRTDIVRELIAAGADVNLRDEDGETALMKAIDEHYPETADILRQAGAR